MELFHGRADLNSSRANQNKKNQRGQIAIEGVLLMTILLAGFLVVRNKLQTAQPIQKLMDHGAKRIKHMTEYGVWREQCRPVSGGAGETAANCHPNSINRSLSSLPE